MEGKVKGIPFRNRRMEHVYQSGGFKMAYICNKTEKCQECEHYRFDPDEGRYACFAEQDEKEKPFKEEK